MKYKFECGCEFDLIRELGKDRVPILKFDYESSFNETCPAVWKLLGDGHTLGVFQLESGLGQTWCKELRPLSIEHLAALTAILRPGAMNSLMADEKNITSHYCKRKNNKEPCDQPIVALRPILQDTYQLLIYQEGQLEIGKQIAGFNLGDADYYLRKAVGQKNAQLLFSVEEKFLEGCKQVGKVSNEEAKTVFGWIKSAARYSFNKCCTLDTQVETPNEVISTLEEINIGDLVKGPNLENDKDEFIQVTDKIDCGEQDVYEITLESGKTIKCTMDHKFLCEDRQIRTLFEIIENDYKILCEPD